MAIIFSILGLLLLTLIIGKINLSIKFRKQVKELFAQSKKVSDQRFCKKQLDNLPEPVKRYFNHILKEGQPYISSVRIKHEGKFKADLKKDWMNIKGEQYATTENLASFGKALQQCLLLKTCILLKKGD